MKKLLTVVMTIAEMAAFAVPMVSNETARQRFPWNGLVDITCTVSGIDGTTNGLKFAVSAVMPDSGDVRKVSHFLVVRNGTNSTDRMLYTNGDYRFVWDARADLGQVIFSNMVIRVTTIEAHRKIQLWEGGAYWAETNIGAEEPWEYGYYFWWGDTVGYRRENNAWVAADGSSSNFSFSSSNAPVYCKNIAMLQSEGWIVSKDGTNVLAPEHDAAHVQWGGEWRMPTIQELVDLKDKCDWTWTTMNGVEGYVVRGKGAYFSNSIFLPAAGYGIETSFSDAGSLGDYWSSVPYSDYYASWPLTFVSSGRYTYSFYRHYGFSVRPVQGFTN